MDAAQSEVIGVSGGITFRGEITEKLGLSLGGLGTGTLEIDRAGRFRRLAVQNNWCTPVDPVASFLSLHVRSDKQAVGRLLQLEGLSGLPGMSSLTYRGHFPFVSIDYEDESLPCSVSLEAFSPFVAHDADSSSLPLVFLTLRVTNCGALPLTVAAAVSWHNDIAVSPGNRMHRAQGNWNKVIDAAGCRGVLMGTDSAVLAGSEYLLAAVPEPGVTTATVADWWQDQHGRWLGPNVPAEGADGAFPRWAEFLDTGTLPEPAQIADGLGEHSYHCPAAAVSCESTLAPGEVRELRFVLAWTFPHHRDTVGHDLGHAYAVRFPHGTRDVLQWALPRFSDLRAWSRRWTELIDHASLPANTRNLITNVAYMLPRATWWLADGRFLNYESINCPLMNPVVLELYSAPAMAALFPDQHALALRNSIEYQLESGEIPTFLGHCSVDEPRYRVFSIQDVSAFVLAVYWQTLWGGGGPEFMTDMYPVVKGVLQYGESLDLDGDGVPDAHGIDQAWDTWPMYGAAMYVADPWLAACKAGAALAQRVGDPAFQTWCERLFSKAAETIESRLWNGSYYRLYDDPANERRSETCFLDQFAGQAIASLLGLGELHPPERIRSSLEAIWEHNVRPCRHGARSGAMPDGTPDKSSTTNAQSNSFTPACIAPGCAVAMRYGMLDEAVALAEEMADIIINQVQDPWHGLLLFDADTGEHFYGSHYIDILILWQVLHALTGYQVNILDRTLTLTPPRVPVTGPVFTKLFFGEVRLSRTGQSIELQLCNAADAPCLLGRLAIHPPEGLEVTGDVQVNGRASDTAVATDGAVTVSDLIIPAGDCVTVAWT